MIYENIINEKNNKNMIWIDCVYTKHLKNGFCFNIHLFENTNTNKNIYELRLGVIDNIEKIPVITLFKSDKYEKVAEYMQNIDANASDLYLFDMEV